MANILVIEDEDLTSETIKRAFQKEGHVVTVSNCLKNAKTHVSQDPNFDLIFLDRLLPDGDGIDLCRELKKNPLTKSIPVIVLTNVKGFEEEISSYKTGADLFLQKPVQTARLKDYAEAFLSRNPETKNQKNIFRYGVVTIDQGDQIIFLKETRLHDVPPRMYKLFSLLASFRGRFVSRRTIVWKIWKNSVKDKEVDVAISRLRKRLGPKWSDLIQSSPGKGYALLPGLSQKQVPS